MALTAQDLKSNLIFCDGACSGNPGKGGWGTIVVTPEGQVAELGGGEVQTTNNRMELKAALAGLEHLIGKPHPTIVFTDSTYVIRGITQWVWGWRQRGWKTAEGKDVLNQDLWAGLVRAVAAHGTGKVDWRYVRGHTGVPGNERVDEIAVAYTKGKPAGLYVGSLLGYSVPVHDVPENGDLPEMRPKTAKSAAYSYLSMVDGVAQRHSTWPECERRVKGRSGARFKKTTSEAEERQILASWGARL